MGYLNSKTDPKYKDSWSTPDYIFNFLDKIYNFEVDLAASAENAKMRPYLNEEANALGVDWSRIGHSGFCNPPYSNIKPWIEKAIEEAERGFTTVMLIPTPNGESYYEDLIINADTIIFIKGRVSFIGSDGKPKSGNNRGSCIVVFRKGLISSSPRVGSIDRDLMRMHDE